MLINFFLTYALQRMWDRDYFYGASDQELNYVCESNKMAKVSAKYKILGHSFFV